MVVAMAARAGRFGSPWWEEPEDVRRAAQGRISLKRSEKDRMKTSSKCGGWRLVEARVMLDRVKHVLRRLLRHGNGMCLVVWSR